MTPDLFTYYTRLLRRYRWLLATITAGFTCIGILLALIVPPRYTATARLIVTSAEKEPIQIAYAVKSLPATPATLSTEVHRITSDAFLGRVVDLLDLIKDPEFAGGGSAAARASRGASDQSQYVSGPSSRYDDSPAPPTGFASRASDIIAAVVAYSLPEREQQDARSRVTKAIAKRLNVALLRGSNALDISFTSTGREKSALVANAVAEQYVDEQLTYKRKVTEQARVALDSRLESLRQQMLSARETLEAFRAQQGLLDVENREGRRVTLSVSQLSYLSEQHVQAQIQLRADEAQLQEIENLRQSGRNIDSVPAVLQSELIRRLREQEAEVIRRRADAVRNYGEEHPTLQSIRAELRDVRSNIRREIDKAALEIANKVEVSRTRALSIDEQLRQQSSLVAAQNLQSARLAQLQDDADARRGIYESFSQRSQELLEQVALYQPDAEIISPAMIPFDKSYPSRSLVVALSFLAGASTAVLTALLLERWRSSVPGAEHPAQTSRVSATAALPPIDVVNDEASGTLQTACRDIMTKYLRKRPGSTVLLIASFFRGEGKTVVAAHLARAACSLGIRCLIINGNMPAPGGYDAFRADMGPGLADLLRGRCTLMDVVRHDEETGADYLSAGRYNEEDIELSGTGIRELLSELRSDYSLILLDSPPLQESAEPLLWSRCVDAVLFAVARPTTTRGAVLAAARECTYGDGAQLLVFLT